MRLITFYFHSILVVFLFMGIVFCENSKGLFNPQSKLCQNLQTVQINRLKSRKNRIDELINQINSHYESLDKTAVQEDISMLGDECRSLYRVIDLSRKKTRKIKSHGTRINNNCLKLSRKLNKTSIVKTLKYWKKIKFKIEKFFKIEDPEAVIL